MYKRAEYFHILDRWVTQGINVTRAVHRGLWLGFLDGPALNQATAIKYSNWDKYQSSAYNLSGLAHWEQAVLERFFGDCRSILLGGAGGGREILGLLERGYQVDAFECNQELVESCSQLLVSQEASASVIQSTPDQVPETLGRYDGLIVGWGTYMHIPGRDARIHFLQAFRQHVFPGGPILLSFFTRDPTSRHYHWVYQIAHRLRRLRRSAYPLELGDDLDGTFDHHFTESEIAEELHAGEFEMVHFSNTPYGHAVARAI